LDVDIIKTHKTYDIWNKYLKSVEVWNDLAENWSMNGCDKGLWDLPPKDLNLVKDQTLNRGKNYILSVWH
jgi:hypothetical protein